MGIVHHDSPDQSISPQAAHLHPLRQHQPVTHPYHGNVPLLAPSMSPAPD